MDVMNTIDLWDKDAVMKLKEKLIVSSLGGGIFINITLNGKMYALDADELITAISNAKTGD